MLIQADAFCGAVGYIANSPFKEYKGTFELVVMLPDS